MEELSTVGLGEDGLLERPPASETGEFSEQMLERVRVAYNLVHDLEVNLPGVAIIVQMREEMSGLRHRLEGLLKELKGGGST